MKGQDCSYLEIYGDFAWIPLRNGLEDETTNMCLVLLFGQWIVYQRILSLPNLNGQLASSTREFIPLAIFILLVWDTVI